MKKRLFCLFVFSLLFMSIQVVFAEKVSYEWGDYFSSKDVSSDDNRVYDVIEKDGGYFIYGNKVAHLYDKDGKVLNEKYDSNEYEYEYIYYDEESKQFFGDVKWREFDENNEYFEYRRAYVILDENRKEIKMVDADDYDYYYDVINDNNNYYVLINLDSGVILVKKDLSSVERFDYEDLTDKELKDYLGEYYDIVKLNISNEDSNKYYYSLKSNDNYKILISYNYKTQKHVLEFYDKNDNFLFRKYVDTSNNPFVELGNDGFYLLVEEDIDDRDECYYKGDDETCSSQLVLYKYDYSNNKVYEENLSKLTSDHWDYYIRRGNKVSNMKLMDGKLFILINFLHFEPVNLSEEVTDGPTVLVYSFTYDIEYKTDGNGEIKAINSSKAGDNVTFTVTPNEGYVLEKVKVTDKSGNTIIFTDNTFTMPSSDVIIEASFKSAENPDTSDIAIVGCIIIIVLGVVLTFLNFRKFKELE